MKTRSEGSALRHPGVAVALGSALLFGAGTPFAKLLLADVNPLMLAGLLYLGAGVGLLIVRLIRRSPPARLPRRDVPWLAAAVLAGGVLAPALLMLGLSKMPATGASLLLNAEGVFTVLIAWVVFKENADRRVILGVVAIVAGSLVLSWPGQAQFAGALPTLAVVGACALWAVDNNLTRRVSGADSTWVAMVKGLVAGTVNLVLALCMGSSLPAAGPIAGALVVGFFAYGASLAMFVVGLRLLGTARTGAYFSVAPFFGALLAVVLLREAITFQLALAGALMAIGVVLHLSEKHRHRHTHAELTHAHSYDSSDEHHAQAVALGDSSDGQYLHRHTEVTHDHRHYPDLHHRHDH